MPNHISNKLSVVADTYEKQSEQFKQICELMKSEERQFDFNKVLPYPEEFAKADKARREAEKNGVDYRDLPKDGFNAGGYEWCCDNWGTKWNAYEVNVGYDEITFQTAWSMPEPVIIALSEALPEIEIKIEYADEDWGNNCAIRYYKNGKITKIDEVADWNLWAQNLCHEVELRFYQSEYYKLINK